MAQKNTWQSKKAKRRKQKYDFWPHRDRRRGHRGTLQGNPASQPGSWKPLRSKPSQSARLPSKKPHTRPKLQAFGGVIPVTRSSKLPLALFVWFLTRRTQCIHPGFPLHYFWSTADHFLISSKNTSRLVVQIVQSNGCRSLRCFSIQINKRAKCQERRVRRSYLGTTFYFVRFERRS